MSSLTKREITYYITHTDGVYQVFSKVNTLFGGYAHNFVAEVRTQEDAEALIKRLRSL